MDIGQIRHSNLQTLISAIRQARPGRLQKDIAADLDLSASHLSQHVGGKYMGDSVARKIERARGLPVGWMDQLHASANRVSEHPSPAYQSQVLRVDPDTIAAALKLVRLSFLQLDKEIDQEENGEPLAYAYEFLWSRQEASVTAENLIDFGKWLKRRREGAEEDARAGDDRSAGGTDRQHDEGRKAS